MLRLDAIDLGDLAMALENHFMDYGTFFWLDPETGQIDLWSEEVAGETGETVEDLDERRCIRIDPVESNVGYRDMEVFASKSRGQGQRERLERAINGPRPFRHFKDALQLFPGLEAEWYEFHDSVMKRRAIEWLVDNDLVDQAEAASAIRAMQEPV